ncbi:MAG TPA: glycoside hydrolase family 3 C-terminal domain-containing protein [Polyangiaceae bacterium]|nr:glycoside hydrolase family 3 C-terminal domain-containing protein [Polyangiaceae bacterium]
MPQPTPSTSRRIRFFLGSVAAVGLAAAVSTQACARLKGSSSSSAIVSTSGTSGGGSGSTDGDGGAACAPSTRDMDEQDADTVVNGGAAAIAAVTPTACGDSLEQLTHTPGILPDGGLLDISQAVGYKADSTIPSQAQTMLQSAGANNLSSYANQMRGNIATTQSADIYRTEDDPKTDIKGILFRDGPRGVNLDSPVFEGPYGGNSLNIGGAYATVFPVSAARAATWDLDLEARIGEDIADEVVGSENTETISPCVNILRNPAWGRSQETYGEDPFALGRLGSAYVHGVQSYVPACAKHFAANNIENNRQNLIAIMDSQTLHEIYGRHFEMIVQDGGVACVMASYNSLQVTDGSDVGTYKNTVNTLLLTDVLRNTFGFKGFIMSDFWAMPGFNSLNLTQQQYDQTGTEGVNAGLDIEMPWALNFKDLESLFSSNTAPLQAAATYIVEQKLRFNVANANANTYALRTPVTTLGPNGITNNCQHIADSELQAEEAMVLLKNDPLGGSSSDAGGGGGGNGDEGGGGGSSAEAGTMGEGGAGDEAGVTQGGGTANEAGTTQGGGGGVVSGTPVLPIDHNSVHTIAVLGTSEPWALSGTGQSGTFNFATDARIGDLGSSRVNPDPATTVGPFAGIQAAASNYGITVTTGSTASDASGADFVVVIAGMTPQDEGEDYTGASDRADSNGNPNYSLDAKQPSQYKLQDQLIMDVAALGKPMVVILEGGSAINMPWLDQVPAVVMSWYAGQQGGIAMGRLLFGEVNFSGKLPITWPKSEADEPTFNTGPAMGGATSMGYYLGYRWFDQQSITPLFAYGSGKSYTTFRYDFVGIPCSTVTKHSVVDVQVAVTNTGSVAGNEISYLFTSLPANSAVHRSVKELKGWHRTKQPIQPGQTVLFTIPLRVADLKYWNSAGSPPAWTVDPGDYPIMIGPSSDNLTTAGKITVTAQ